MDNKWMEEATESKGEIDRKKNFNTSWSIYHRLTSSLLSRWQSMDAQEAAIRGMVGADDDDW